MYLRLNSCKLETRSRQDKTVWSCCQCSHRRHRQDKTRQFCLIHVGGVNKLYTTVYTTRSADACDTHPDHRQLDYMYSV